MNHFTIKDIENLCGIKAHTLRIWEQRYNKLFVPKRKQSQHRIYDNDDLKELLRISFLYHNGHKISRIAELNPEQIQQLVETFSITEANHEWSRPLGWAGEKYHQCILSIFAAYWFVMDDEQSYTCTRAFCQSYYPQKDHSCHRRA